MKLFVIASLVVIASCIDMRSSYDGGSGYDNGSGLSGETVEIERIIEVEGSGIKLIEVIGELLEDQDGNNRRRRDTEEAEAGTTLEPTTTTTTGSTPVNKTCTILAECEDSDDCNGGTCAGFFPGKCNCNACITALPCNSDAACGGLQGACNTTKKACDCFGALAQHGYPTVLNALQDFCNAKSCKKDECAGLKCNKGFCTCPPKKEN
ncbi:unnamed protein product, partial [Mesorhabditis belari]|uniref:Chondroitin proteoglycan 3 n=1 Tax=Mesorhabditis belari TaxID=2138241 RepID=A0AAF3ENN7_9BILA